MLRAHLDEDIRTRGIEWLNVFAVDNVLQRIADPVFVGATILSGCVCGSKVVRKVSPYERVGAMCLEDGKADGDCKNKSSDAYCREEGSVSG